MKVLATAIREEKETKGIQIGKEVKLPLSADDMILYTENPKDATGKLLELNEFDKVTRYKVDTEKYSCISIHLQYERSGIQETISFITTTERIKYLGINLLKEAKDLYS